MEIADPPVEKTPSAFAGPADGQMAQPRSCKGKYRLTPGSEAVQDIPEAVYTTTRGRSLRTVV